MSKQIQADMGLEEAEAAVALGLSGLPEVVSAHYAAHHDVWDLVVVHDGKDGVEPLVRIARQIIGLRGKMPRLGIDPMVVTASEEERSGATAGMKTIYRRE